jgi:pimeloyl-ACP methyl ester carboxylesterase
MRWIGGLILALFVCVTFVDAQTPGRDPRQVPPILLRPGMRRLPQPQIRQTPLLIVSPHVIPPNITPVACPEPTADLCGYIAVPLDRRHPKRAQFQIYFERYPHTGSGPAQSAILVNLGGPGFGTTGDRDNFQFFFANNLDVHDLLLVDDRGRRLSGAINCPELQHGTAPFAQSEIDCAAQLGDSASRYGTGDIAQDMEALRKALGYELLDYLGASWGGVDATAYATRYGKHVRSLVLDAPVSPPNMAELLRLHYRTNSDPRMVRLDCLRSLLCSQDQTDPDETFAGLIQMVRENPVEGDGHDSFGNVVHVRIDEDALLNFIVTYPSGPFVNTGEILAAAVALKKGDAVPLLRLGAEGFFTLVGDSGDPTNFSDGAFYATGCMDTIEPFSWSASFSERHEQFEEAVDELPFSYFAPFSKGPATGILFSRLGKQCLWWEQPTAPSPIVPEDGLFPSVPTLVLDGDLDNRAPFEETNLTAALYPNSNTVIVAGAGHETTTWFQCARNLASQFIETLQPGDTSCANTPEVVWAAVGRFPLLVKDARPADVDPSGNNEIGVEERKTVSVSVATAIDALKRSLLNFLMGTGVGLRGGTFSTVFDNTGTVTVTLTNCAFASDVIVNGTLVWPLDNSIAGDLTVSGPGTAGGILHITGFFLNLGPVGNFTVTGTLGGKQVAVLVPEA